jgi:hypothetical protein
MVSTGDGRMPVEAFPYMLILPYLRSMLKRNVWNTSSPTPDTTPSSL